MRTYSKRQRLTKPKGDNDVALEASNDSHTGRKHLNADTNNRPSKRRKSAQSMMDAASFVTPHPTKEAQEQAYKLPSTKPMPSPYPFSPVPTKRSEHSLDNNTSQRSAPFTTSRNLKENGRGNIPSLRYSSKTLSSFTLTSGSGPLSSHYKGSNENRPKSRNLKTRNQTSGYERSEPTKPKSIVDQISKPNEIDDDRKSPKEPSSPSKTTRPKIHYSASNLTGQTLLASPFASRASSPVASESSGNVVSRKAECDDNTRSGISAPTVKRGQGLTEVYVDLKILSRSSQKLVKKKRNRQSSSAHNSPEKSGREKPLSAELFYRKIRPSDENNYPWKDRRPSAPSNLQRPSKQVSNAYVPSRTARKVEDHGDKTHTQKRFVLACTPPAQPLEDIQVFNDDFEFDLIDNHDPISWMLPHSTNFNRPPSQMSMVGVFLSPGDGDEGVKKPTDGLDPNGYDGTWVTSTPFKEVLARKQSFSVVPNFLEGEVVDKDHPYHDFTEANGRSEKVTELAVSLEGGDDTEINETNSPFQDHTPWITDSIISPPTEYLQMKGKAADAAPTSGPDRRDGDEDDVKVIHHVNTSENVGSPDLASHIRRMEDDEECGHSGDVDVAPHTVVMVEPRRTRSGTILASQSSASIGRTRSGTITSNGGNSKRPFPLAGIRRTRNGTIIGPLPDLTGSGSGAIESGSIRKPDDITKVSARKTGTPSEVKPDGVQGDSSSVGSTTSPSRMDRADNGLEWTLDDVEEAEFYADSLFVPLLVSSPDPIDFLRFANAKEGKGLMDRMNVSCHVGDGPVGELQWTGKGIFAEGTRPSRRVKAKGKQTRFMGTHGQVEILTREDDSALQFEVGETDDELLLVEGQSLTLFC